MGTHTFPDGSGYAGEWLRDKPHGQGRWEYEGGVLYEGGWFQGYRHGTGRLDTKQGHYQGDWRYGQQEGGGTWTTPEGEYKGEWHEGRPQGKGTWQAGAGVPEAQIWAEGLQRQPGLKFHPPQLHLPPTLDWHTTL